MKNKWTLIVASVAVFIFVGDASSQQSAELSSGGLTVATVAASDKLLVIPKANTVRLSSTPNVLNSKGCPITAWVGYVNSQGNGSPLKGYEVNFVKVSGSRPAPASGLSDTNGEVKRIVQWGTVVRATVQSGQQSLTSTNFACTNRPRQ